EFASGASPSSAVSMIDGVVYGGSRQGLVSSLEAGDAVQLRGTPASACTALAVAPQGALVAGFADGTVGVWDPQLGEPVALDQLEGRIAHIVVTEREVIAESDLGYLSRMPLGLLTRPYCEVMRELWEDYPGAWTLNGVELAPPPADHPCAP
ncbi:MAG: hypothetical protein AB7P00_43660, partial [Sandaracinaceae bacterium]